MKRIIFGFFVILSAFTINISAQTFAQQRFEKGMIAASDGKYAAALADFKMSLAFLADEKSDNEFRARIHYNIGVCFYQLKEQTKAVAEFERAVKLNPNHEKSFYSLGMAQFELKNWKESEAAFRGALRVNNRNGETWFDLAFVYLAQKDYDTARAAFQKAVKYKSVDSAIAHNNLGVILVMNGDVKAAIREFETALRQSSGGFAVAERNLQFCKSLGQNTGRELLAKLEFGK
jgi:tetratricopeptide (TPR) repeat protein